MDNNLLNRIIALREEKGINQSELGTLMNLGNSVISKIENGSRKVSAEELKKLSDIFGVSTDYLVGNNQTPKWANKKDTVDLKEFLDNNLNINMAYDGEDLSKEELERLKIAMTQIFWEKQKQKK
ncbi:transcriptional regulator [Paucilactobacillus hokkaidonensis JCM 18461]|uniref:Transcriptional regulator n=2 Tax=Paucilactobacillus hokkaidonensis TaxID=1193095 RepID=A0A0A1H094_9LACO|nr:helix-turn-helix domain-containing protein [Paucilactobacillus hokkaidonensis]KRO09430.1 hypothetical protein IV59_GL000643 [Paucilactobacillus hokkaidonensis]BAP86678.1 transcriptional regulator [Paucilactobacillus hokkaidonensis JCM 18461]